MAAGPPICLIKFDDCRLSRMRSSLRARGSERQAFPERPRACPISYILRISIDGIEFKRIGGLRPIVGDIRDIK